MQHRAAGTVLIVTIWIVLVLSGLALVFARSMRVAAAISANQVASLEAESIAAGALQYVVAKLAESAQEQTTTSTTSTSQTTDTYEALPVGDGYFWVLQSNLEDDRESRFGLTDESGKINLNTASLETLQKLPDRKSVV